MRTFHELKYVRLITYVTRFSDSLSFTQSNFKHKTLTKALTKQLCFYVLLFLTAGISVAVNFVSTPYFCLVGV